MQRDVQDFLNEAYEIAIDVLDKHFATKLQTGNRIPLTSEEEKVVKNVTWRPIAQHFVVTMLRPILLQSPNASIVVTKQELSAAWKKEETPDELAKATGLVGEDVTAAMEAIADAIYSSPLLARPQILQINGISITVSRQ